MAGEPTFRILCVCTGNVCRSPMAERLLGHHLGGRPGAGGAFTVTSAGTGALVGAPMSGPSADLLVGRGVGADGFAARQLQVDMVAGADLVLGMAREHRAAAAALDPGAVPRSFTLLELAAVAAAAAGADLGDEPVSRARALVVRAAAERGGPAGEVPDPYGGPPRAYRPVFEMVAAATAAIVAVIADT